MLAALAILVNHAYAQAPAAAPLSAAERESAKKIYFERCAGCHGVLRKGATGKNLEPHWSRKLADGTVAGGRHHRARHRRLEKMIAYGTDGGDGRTSTNILSTKGGDRALMSRYIQEAPDVPLEYSLTGRRATRGR